MAIQKFWDDGMRFLHICTVYFAVQLVRCALLSAAVLALILIARKTIFRHRVFLKGALWSMLLPVVFAGRLKFFYESSAGKKLFSWLTAACMKHVWLCRLYVCVVLCYAAVLFVRKRKWKKLTAGMEKRCVEQVTVYVTKLPVTPSGFGIFSPRIVMPDILLRAYDREEIRMILLHERMHIRLGHFIFYALWDVLRVLLWPNLLFLAGTACFREDLEDICDRVTIQKSGGSAYAYGRLLLKSMRLLQTEGQEFNMYAAFTGHGTYAQIRRRLERIVRFRPYKRLAAAGMWALIILCAGSTLFLTHDRSYRRCEKNDTIVVYDMDGSMSLTGDGGDLRHFISYDENFVYIEPQAFRRYMEEGGMRGEKLCICFGGYYKLPGIGGGSSFGYVDRSDLGTDILKISYTKQADLFCRIFRLL